MNRMGEIKEVVDAVLFLTDATFTTEELTAIALSLRERVALAPQQRFRLVGVGVSNFLDSGDVLAQPSLFR